MLMLFHSGSLWNPDFWVGWCDWGSETITKFVALEFFCYSKICIDGSNHQRYVHDTIENEWEVNEDTSIP